MTFHQVRAVALKLPNVVDGTSYGAPALKLKNKLLVRLREELDSIVLPMPFETRDALIAEDPATYYITDHYLNYEYVLAHLSRLDAAKLRDLLAISYRIAAKKTKS